MTEKFERTRYEGCPLCGFETFMHREPQSVFPCAGHALWRPGLPTEMQWLRCVKCSHEFTNGYFDGDAARFLSECVQREQVHGADFEMQRYVAADVLDRVFSWCEAARRIPKTMLDVGFGSGALLTTAVEYGLNVYGVDMRAEAVEPLKARGFEVFVGGVEEIRKWVTPNGFFDLVVLADVLEHVPFPGKLLEEVSSVIYPGQWLFVSCPNTDSFVWRELGEKNPYLSELEHFHNFGFRRLKLLLEDKGFSFYRYAVSRRYRAGMEVLARKLP